MADGMALLATSASGFRCRLRRLFAATEAHAGRLDVAFASLNNTFAEVERSGAHYFTSELYRQRGELLMYEPGLSGQAEEAFKRAIEIARSQNARCWSCAPPPASPALARPGQNTAKRAISSRRSTAGSPRGSRRLT